MEIYNSYEALDMLAEKSKMFEMIRTDFLAKDDKIAALEEENLNTMMALTDVYEQLLMLQMGGTV